MSKWFKKSTPQTPIIPLTAEEESAYEQEISQLDDLLEQYKKGQENLTEELNNLKSNSNSQPNNWAVTLRLAEKMKSKFYDLINKHKLFLEKSKIRSLQPENKNKIIELGNKLSNLIINESKILDNLKTITA